jgi:hypothetical protein
MTIYDTISNGEDKGAVCVAWLKDIAEKFVMVYHDAKKLGSCSQINPYAEFRFGKYFFRIFLIYVDCYELETVYGDDKNYHWATIHNTFSEKDFSKYVRSMCKRIRRMEMYDKLDNKELDF